VRGRLQRDLSRLAAEHTTNQALRLQSQCLSIPTPVQPEIIGDSCLRSVWAERPRRGDRAGLLRRFGQHLARRQAGGQARRGHRARVCGGERLVPKSPGLTGPVHCLRAIIRTTLFARCPRGMVGARPRVPRLSGDFGRRAVEATASSRGHNGLFLAESRSNLG
jgi:hypothetical protein